MDLNVANKRNIDDVDDDEQEKASVDLDFGDDFPPRDPDAPQEPPRQRRRLLPLPQLDSEGHQLDLDDDELSITPTTPVGPEEVLWTLLLNLLHPMFLQRLLQYQSYLPTPQCHLNLKLDHAGSTPAPST